MLFGLFRKDKKPSKLNLSKNYNAKYLFSKLPYYDKTDNPIFQSSIIDVVNSTEDFQKFLLGTTDIGENIQEGIKLVVMKNELNDATVCYKFDTVYHSVLRRQNPYKILFKDLMLRTQLLAVYQAKLKV